LGKWPGCGPGTLTEWLVEPAPVPELADVDANDYRRLRTQPAFCSSGWSSAAPELEKYPRVARLRSPVVAG